VARREGTASIVSSLLAAIAGALGRLLGLARPLAVPPPVAPPVLSGAMASPYVPRHSLGLRGSYALPQTGGEP
jgi:hypothetical protein